MKKKLVSLFVTAFALLAISVSAWAAGPNQGTESNDDQITIMEAEDVVVSQVNDTSNEELFAEYVDNEIGIMMFSDGVEKNNLGYQRLTERSLEIYKILRAGAAEIADGQRESTEFVISVGVDCDEMEIASPDDLTQEAFSQAGTIIRECISDAIDYLLVDCPYELYWYDKAEGISISIGYDGENDGYTLMIEVTLNLCPAQAYAGGDAQSVDIGKTGAAKNAIQTATTIRNNAAALNDYEKIVYYKDQICALTEYNDDAMASPDVPYGDPWQMIWVFDGDPTTNVVCEGYSKAFQYLYELTTFEDDIRSIIVSGLMGGGTGAGNHMWNVVRMNDGKNYLVDVTNCDEDAIGSPNKLLLAGTPGSVSEGYQFVFDEWNSTAYKYDNDTLYMYDTLDLEIAESNYELHEHEWTLSESQDPTCEEDGFKKYTCSCEREKTETLEAKGHTEVVDKAVDATCTEDGLTEGKHCSVCDKVFVEQETIPAMGHQPNEPQYENVIDATCTKAGSYDKVVYCKVCGEELSREKFSDIELPHDYKKVVTEPTCTEGGYTTYTCTTCGDSYQSDEVDAIGHIEAIDEGKTATCTEDGLTEGKHCSVCGDVLATQETIPAKGHTEVIDKAVAATCTTAGKTQGTHCSTCKTVLTEQKSIAALGHNYQTETTKATPTTNGSIVTKCTVCGNVSSSKNIAAVKTVTLSKTAFVYNGKIQKPAVVVKDASGKSLATNQYKVTYASGCKNVGKYAVKVTLTGNYSGTISATYSINPKATKIATVKPGKKAFAVTWAKQAIQTTGYEVQYSTSQKFTKATTKSILVKKPSTVTKTVKNLKAKKKYYVRIRTYKVVSGKTYNSAWSPVKTVTTK